MAISLSEASKLLIEYLPEGTTIVGSTTKDGKHLFLAPNPDPLEGQLDPFFEVDSSTGAIQDFSPGYYDNPVEILTALNAYEGGVSQ